MLFLTLILDIDPNNNEYSLNILQNSYAIETEDKKKRKNKK